MFALLSLIRIDTSCDYTDRYGLPHRRYCNELLIGGVELHYLTMDSEIQNLVASSMSVHAYAFYYGTVLMKRLHIPFLYRFALFLTTSLGWELYEAYGMRTTPISPVDLMANTFGFLIGEIGGNRVDLRLGLHPMREYRDWWVERGEVNDRDLLLMLMGRFNTNFSPHTLYINAETKRFSLKVGYNLGATHGKGFIYTKPLDTTAIPSLFVSGKPPYLYLAPTPFPPIAEPCGDYLSFRCGWSWSVFLSVSFVY